MELFDERQKFGIMTMPELALLSQDFSQHAYRRGSGRCRHIGNDGYFNGFPDKVGVKHVLDGNLDNEDAALRLNDH